MNTPSETTPNLGNTTTEGLVIKLNSQNFLDANGHPLKSCVEFRELARRAAHNADEVVAVEAALALVPRPATCQGCKHLYGAFGMLNWEVRCRANGAILEQFKHSREGYVPKTPKTCPGFEAKVS